MKLTKLIPLLPVIALLVNSEIALARITKKPIIKGNCGKQKCEVLFKQLSDLYPDYTKKYTKGCTGNQIMSLATYPEYKKVYFTCWEAKKQENGDRYGSSLGALPIPGNESKFLTPLPNNTPYTKYLQQKYGTEIKKAQFQCATNSGNFNLLISEDQKSIQLQCYYQAGEILVDSNNDWKSDGEVTRGAGVDEILGTFPIDNFGN
ncbi:MAG: hypothetical protein ACK6A9_16585 [Dolichospermum sp.]|jgi:hypothetical protein|nr:hypothetical protein [Anabaena sp. 49628_E55]